MSVSLQAIEPGIAVLKVDRPAVRNALNWDAIHTFRDRIEAAHAMEDLCALIVTGSEQAFIAGGDLKELHGYSTAADGEKLSSTMRISLDRLEALPCPTIAAMNGPARGGGAEISLACDMRIMARDADIGFVQIQLGLTPGWGAGQRLLRMVGYSRALEWLVSGRILSAEEALGFGVANRLAPSGKALQTALEGAREISKQPAQSVRALKRMLRGGLYLPPEMAWTLEGAEFPRLWASEPHLQAVQRFINRK